MIRTLTITLAMTKMLDMQSQRFSLHKETYRRNECVIVYMTHERFGGLSNMASGFPLSINGVRIPTSEALYQACRFPHLPNVQRIIIGQRSPMTAKMKSKPYRNQTRADWDSVRVQVMDWCLRVKLAQHWDAFSRLLLSTEEKPIVEESRKDDFWGAKAQDMATLVGTNVLGQLLMNLRRELKQESHILLKTVSPPPLRDFMLIGKPIGVVTATEVSADVIPKREEHALFSHAAERVAVSTEAQVTGTNQPYPLEQETVLSGSSYPKRLIEVDLPIKRISVHARREKSIRHGHISTLHIWWARRPLAACRAIICAALWPDPADPLCPETFRTTARQLMEKWASDQLKLCGEESGRNFISIQKAPKLLNDNAILRRALLDFIADFANWDASNVPAFVDTAHRLTASAYKALGSPQGTKPLVVDPFAGGGAIPLEALRVGAEAIASDLNPVAVLLNKVALEYIPRYGHRLREEFRRWGEWVKDEAARQLAEYYPEDPAGGKPIAYLWARTIRCEGPGCGVEVPTVGSMWLSKKGQTKVAFRPIVDRDRKRIDFEVLQNPDIDLVPKGIVRRSAVTCPVCGYTTSAQATAKQFIEKHGGSQDARLLFIVKRTKEGQRVFSSPKPHDIDAVRHATEAFRKLQGMTIGSIPLIPHEELPYLRSIFNVHVYGVRRWSEMFSPRQIVSLVAIHKGIRRLVDEDFIDSSLREPVLTLLALLFDRVMVRNTAFCIWDSTTQCIMQLFNQGQSLPIRFEYAEMVPLADEGSGWTNSINYIEKVIDENSNLSNLATVLCADASQPFLPENIAQAVITDPPYYDSVPYANLSDFFFVWLKRNLTGYQSDLLKYDETPKSQEIVQLAERNQKYSYKTKANYETLLTRSLENMRLVVEPGGIGTIVFAHKSTEGWEAAIKSVIDSGWVVTASWPIDTEMRQRLRAQKSAALASSVHLVCRPRENPDGSLRMEDIGDWRDILTELPVRIHEWMPRLAEEGVVGADAIFACLGPALEIFSRYSRVEKASGEAVTLKEYLEQVWAAVAKEALTMVFQGADASGFEEDARLTAMWLWTLRTSESNGNGAVSDEDSEEDEQEESTQKAKSSGFALEYDAARKIAQGLGAHLEDLTSLVEIKGDTARLLLVAERTRALFGKDEAQAPTTARRKKESQLKLGFEAELQQAEESSGWGQKGAPRLGSTILDRVHQAMILFAAGRGEALRRFLVDEGVGRDERFWRLAQALVALYPPGSDERRWVEGVQARKKGLGF